MLRKLISRLNSFLDHLAPSQPKVPLQKSLSISLGVGLTLFLIIFLNHAYGALNTPESMVTAVFGVTALLIFLFPGSKLYSPTAILEANLLAVCFGFACVYLFSAISLGIAIAVLGTILGLYFLGCMHPPALFLAAVIVLARVDRFEFAIHPILVDSLIVALASYLNQILLVRK